MCCRFAPVQVWALNHNHGCAFCLASDTVPPSFVSPFHKSASTEKKGRECVKNTVLSQSRPDLFSSNHFALRPPSSLTALHSVVNHCGSHSPISHSWTAAGLSRCAHSVAGTTVKSFPVFWTHMMSRR